MRKQRSAPKAREPKQFEPVTDRITRIEIPKHLLRLVLAEPLITMVSTTLEERTRDLKRVQARVKRVLAAHKKGDKKLAKRLAMELVERAENQVLEKNFGVKLNVHAGNGVVAMSPADSNAAADVWAKYARAQYPFGSKEEHAALAKRIAAVLKPQSIDLASGVSPYYTPDVAVDGSEAMLLRNPAETRLLGNLDEIILGAQLPLPNASFQTATLVFAEKYFHGPPLIYREARRLLSRSGKLFVVNGRRGESDLFLRDDNTANTLQWLKWSGFKEIRVELLFEGTAPQGFDRHTKLFTASER